MTVQEIADEIDKHAIKGIFIKNPVNADSDLWLGNIERLEKTGVPVAAIHRGCDHHPCWYMAHQVRLRRPDIPMLLDPSHMSGKASAVPQLITKIASLGLDGAMIEVHYKPEEALSDSVQQITPTFLRDNLDVILSQLSLTSEIRPADEMKELNWLRAEIDELDDNLWETIANRMNVSKRIGEWKKAHGVSPLQPERYQQIVEQRTEWASHNGLEHGFVVQLLNAIHEQSLRMQE